MQPAYIQLTPDNYWALYYGDSGEFTPYLLVTGRAFEPGADIREAVAELEAWANANGYTLVTPHYHGGDDIALDTLIEPEIYEEIFGSDDNN